MNEILQKRIEEASKKAKTDFLNRFNWSGNQETGFKEGAVWMLNNQWISVEEDLPPYDKEVIGADYMPELALEQTIIFVHRSNNPNVITDKNKFCVYPPSFCKVTHWMPIPQLKGGEE